MSPEPRFLFRTPTRCQNGHFRFLYYSIRDGLTKHVIWGDKQADCNCPTGDKGEGFAPCGGEQQWTGLRDNLGRQLFEGDLAAHSKYKNVYEVFWSDAGFSVRTAGHTCMLSSLCQEYLTVIGNVCKDRECHHCGKEIGLYPEQCTGWHPAFKCQCGYEEQSAKALTYENCPHCERPVNVERVNAENKNT